MKVFDSGSGSCFCSRFNTINYRLCSEKKFPQSAINKYYIKILLSYGISGLTVTILNTWILIFYFPALQKIGFVLYLIPRLVEEIFMMVIQSYIAAFLFAVYERVVRRS